MHASVRLFRQLLVQRRVLSWSHSNSPRFNLGFWLKFRSLSLCNYKMLDSPSKRQKAEVTSNANGMQNGLNGASHMEVETCASPAVPVLKVARISPDALMPVRGTDQSAGYDLFSNKEMTVPSKGKALVPTDLKIALPEGCYGRIAPRSGLACKKFIDVGAGVIDRDYRGNVHVLLFNFSDEDFLVNKGDRIAQLICERIFMPDLQECQDLDETDRGAGGFGSTGTN